ncbi:hypothetical protein LTR86_009390 [Recurvomyces mirabilis]|nr:hypothetical protein LTR86_009390 [Recurvomyces mirabilis]
MGIERFYPRMQAAGFIQQDEVIGRPGDRSHTHAVLDGPAFAYFVHHRLKLGRSTDGTNIIGIGSGISYAEVAAECLRWLRLLENHGLAVHGVYFDGALPLAKRPTRMRRLRQNAEQLRNYKSRHESGQPQRGPVISLQTTMQQNALPEPPFIVPVVREALSQSAYQDRILVVPGEADNFCVAAARRLNEDKESTKIIILTNDSDLAVFDSGPHTRIAMLHSLASRESNLLSASVYCPAKIAKSINQPDLLQLAYQLQQDTHVSVARVQARIEHNSSATDRVYQDFTDQYSVESEQIMLEKLKKDAKYRLPLLGLDARLAELICQSRDQVNASTQFEVYLPFLIDDPSRASAWHIGTRLRDAAYTLVLGHHKRQKHSILEYKRAGDNIAARKISCLDTADLPSVLGALHASLEHTLEDQHTLSSLQERWRYAVVQTLLWNLVELDQSMPEPDDLLNVVLGRPETSWSQVRLTAQYQACFYSLRLLHQALRYVKCVGDLTGIIDDEHQSAERLLELLDTLPGIADFITSSHVSDGTNELTTLWLELLSTCVREIGAQGDKPVESSRPSKKRKTKKSKIGAESQPQAHIIVPRSSNTFAMLDI